MKPLVSVVIPTFRRPDLLQRAVASVARQTHRPIELIVVDDDGDDRTAEVVRAAMPTADCGLQFVGFIQKGGGGAAARNVGLVAARGRYVQFLDDDDELFPDKLASQVAVLEQENVDVVFGDWRQGQDLASAVRHRRATPDSHFAYLAGVTWVPPFAYLARTGRCRAIGGWDRALRYNDDFDFFLRLAAAGARFHHVPGVTGFYRWHPAPRVSRTEAETRSDTTAAIVARATHLLERRRELTADETRALVRRARRSAFEALPDRRRFALRYAELQDARARAGEATPALEAWLPPLVTYRLRHGLHPLHHARRLAHAVLPLSLRRGVRRWQRRLVADA